MLTPRTNLTRRIQSALDASPSRIPVLVGGCGSGRTTVLQQLRDRVGRTASQHIDVERTATTPERFGRVVASRRRFPPPDDAGAGRARRSTRRWRSCSARARRPASPRADGVTLTALAWQVLVLTGSGTAMGAVLIAETIPRVLFLLLGGVVADRFSRRKVMIWSDSVRGIAVAAIAVLGQLNVLALWHLIVLGAIFGMASAFFFPAYQSIPPQLVDAEQLPSA